MSFRLVPKSVTLNDLERRNGPYFSLFHRISVRHVVVKQLLRLPRFQNLLLIVYDHINTICVSRVSLLTVKISAKFEVHATIRCLVIAFLLLIHYVTL